MDLSQLDEWMHNSLNPSWFDRKVLLAYGISEESCHEHAKAFCFIITFHGLFVYIEYHVKISISASDVHIYSIFFIA